MTYVRSLERRIDSLFDAIAHGDEAHRAWLREAIEAHFSGKPVPPPRGKGNTEAAIARMNKKIEASGLVSCATS
jgi:hypothetical protein